MRQSFSQLAQLAEQEDDHSQDEEDCSALSDGIGLLLKRDFEV